MASYSAFVTQFGEFATTDPGLVNAMLNASILEVDASACGALSDQIIYLKTARKLAKSPSGNTSKLVNRDGSTVYDDELDRVSTLAVGTIFSV